LRRIDEAAAGQATSLDLSRLQLTALPDGLRDLTNLTTLNINNNQLTKLPNWLGNLTTLTELVIEGSQLTALPDSLGNLTALTRLWLGENRLTTLPDSLENLTALTELDLGGNHFTAMPSWLGNLTALTKLYLDNNRLTTLPDSLENLTVLTELDLGGNHFTAMPSWLGNLTALTGLYLDDNRLTSLPDSLGNLTALTTLHLDNNPITSLPDGLGNLTALATLFLGNNQMVSPPPEIVAAGTKSVVAFLRARQDDSAPQWSSKMLVVGEAAVGKTSIAKALCGLEYDPSEPQTHGVHVDSLELAHPDRPDVTMRLSVWDFGGQLEYRATQRFYLTDRSLFLLVWNSRRGWRTGGQVEAWLQAISTAAPGSPIIIVATHCHHSTTDLDEHDIRRRYPKVVDILRVDCADGTGIPQLHRTVTEQAAGLPLMGQRWPTAWTKATEAITARPAHYTALGRVEALMKDIGIGDTGARHTLITALHDRGEILHFAADPELRDMVVLQPTWVDAMITKVLDSQIIADRGGLLGRDHRDQLWPDLDPGLSEKLTAMMERFDLAYRVDSPDHNDVALVVERLRAGAPTQLADAWPTELSDPRMTELRLVYKLASRQAGIPSWFIAREHRYATGIMWSRGVLLQHHGAANPAMALLEDDGSAQPTIRLTVRGLEPHTFFSILNEGFTRIITDRYPGLHVRSLIPCSCDEQPCDTEFRYEHAERALTAGRQLHCNASGQAINPHTLLLGLRSSRENDQLDRIEKRIESLTASTDRLAYAQLFTLDSIRDLLRYRDEQGTRCPSIFTVTKTSRTGYELQLYCEQPDNPHPLPDGAGLYHLTQLPEWLRRYAPYLRILLAGIKLAAPLVAPVITGIDGIVLPEPDKARLELATKLLDQIGDLPGDDTDIAARLSQRPRATADFAQLRAALYAIDPDWGGLRERELPENRGIAYLCPSHRQALRYPAQPAPGLDA